MKTLLALILFTLLFGWIGWIAVGAAAGALLYQHGTAICIGIFALIFICHIIDKTTKNKQGKIQ
jgi:hypothetical protein